MAAIPQQQSGSGLQIDQLAPTGQYIAVCLRVNDLFGVPRPKFDNKNEKEIIDVTRFIFGFFGLDGLPYVVQSYEFKISGAQNSNLMKFLKAWLGQTPLIGWDYCELQGNPVAITIEHKQSTVQPGLVYANISGVAPVHPQLMNLVPPAHAFDETMNRLTNAPTQNRTNQPQQGVQPRVGQAPVQPAGQYAGQQRSVAPHNPQASRMVPTQAPTAPRPTNTAPGFGTPQSAQARPTVPTAHQAPQFQPMPVQMDTEPNQDDVPF